MEKLQIIQVFNCNNILLKLITEHKEFPVSIGFNLLKISKLFDEVEEYVFTIMETTFENFSIENMTEEQKTFFNKILGEEIELDIKKIPLSVFENNEKIKLSITEIDKISIILDENK